MKKQKMATQNVHMYQCLQKPLWKLQRGKDTQQYKSSEPHNETFSYSASFMNGYSAGEGGSHTSCIQKQLTVVPACMYPCATTVTLWRTLLRVSKAPLMFFISSRSVLFIL